MLIPAHNEEAGLPTTLADVKLQTRPGDRILVVSDNCTDATAETARKVGVEVIERTDAERRGKGFALDYGLRHLTATERENDDRPTVVILDADCRLRAGALGALVRASELGPAQARYVMEPPAETTRRQQVSAFALVLKNVVRPRGLSRLGLPCLLTGSGMAFPWGVIQSAELADGNIVEDMQLGLELAKAGHPPRLCEAAEVYSEAPPSDGATRSQRTRWEQGHLRTLLTQAPRLLAAGLTRLRPGLIGLALELAVPPVSLLLLAWAAVTAAAGLAWWFGAAAAAPAFTLAAAGAGLAAATLAAWVRFGRHLLPAAALLTLPFYVIWKVPIYVTFLLAPERKWVRTQRGAALTA